MRHSSPHQFPGVPPLACKASRLVVLMRIVLVTGFCLLVGAGQGVARQPVFDENEIKSAFIFNLTYFVFWNTKALGPPSQPFRILLLEDTLMHEHLKNTVRKETVQDHPIEVDPFPLHPLDAYRIIFVPRNKTCRTQQILNKIQGHQTLVIGETIDFLEKGGMIALIRHGNRIKIHFNRNALIKANIHISSKLYRIGISFNNDQEKTSW